MTAISNTPGTPGASPGPRQLLAEALALTIQASRLVERALPLVQTECGRNAGYQFTLSSRMLDQAQAAVRVLSEGTVHLEAAKTIHRVLYLQPEHTGQPEQAAPRCTAPADRPAARPGGHAV